jgi:hypothetical protein
MNKNKHPTSNRNGTTIRPQINDAINCASLEAKNNTLIGALMIYMYSLKYVISFSFIFHTIMFPINHF